ncbi:MAG: trehalose-phosphatase [Aeromicrobium sp.]|nr:MAG: trehalose-phosphatase [Aeromicrobium sp.]
MMWESLLNEPKRTLVALDFDGTLSPIVGNPERAFIHPRAVPVLNRLAALVGQVAIVTGRPVAQVRELAGFDNVGAPAGLVVFGQYGAEWWDSASDAIIEPEPSREITAAFAELPSIVARYGAEDAFIENKRIAAAIHTRGLAPDVADRLTEPLTDFAREHSLQLEPGRHVLELRVPGADKGQAVAKLAHNLDASSVIYVGDDLGDVPAFEMLGRMRGSGIRTLSVAVASDEQRGLVDRADVSVAGTEGVMDLLEDLAAALESDM